MRIHLFVLLKAIGEKKMFSNKTQRLVDELIEAEYQNAVEQYGEKYESKYQAFCVLQEEVLEAWDEVNLLKEHIVPLLLNTVNDNHYGQVAFIRDVIKVSKNAIKELAQVCAVCEKFEATICEDQKATKGEE